MKTEVRSFENWRIVSLEGKFIIKYIAQVRKVIEPLEKIEHPLVAFDFSATTHMDSSAITLIMNYNRRLLDQKWQARSFRRKRGHYRNNKYCRPGLNRAFV